METIDLNLATAFAFMTCDGNIDPKEIQLIKQLARKGIISADDIDKQLNLLIGQLNQQGSDFMKAYLGRVEDASLTADQAIKLLTVAADTIYADEQVEYREIKFFRALRSRIDSLTDDEILEAIPSVEDFWLQPDAKASIFAPDQDYFNSIELPQFELIGEDKD